MPVLCTERVVRGLATRVFVILGALFAGLLLTASARAQATPAEKINVAEGFQVELVYSVPEQQGSWVSLTDDPQGRLIASDQYGRLYRIDPDNNQVEPIEVKLGRAQGLLCAFDSLYVVAHAGDGQPAGLYRVRDTNDDDKYDSVQLLRQFQGGGEHGPHAVILSPDGESLYVCGGNHTKIPTPEKSLVPRNWQEDQLLPSMNDANGHAAGIKAPGGWIARTNPDGSEFELVASGFRNEYDIAFDTSGELFSYDADMEWDIGTSWYRPTRVCHVTSGAEFGWRTGSGKWPADYPDSLPAILDIGPGSPTGIVFGTGAKFPEKYQKALFICDWSYGLVYAVHMEPQAGSYTAEKEVFCSAPALQVADIIVNRQDQSLYFVIGGRRTQSGLYRVTYTGTESTAPAAKTELKESAQLRRELESLHSQRGDAVIDQAWEHLNHEDRFCRYAARIAIEHQDVQKWAQRALTEPMAHARTNAILALARCASAQPQLRQSMLDSLDQVPWDKVSNAQRIDLLRAYGLVLIRQGMDDKARRQVAARFADKFPADSDRVNQELSRLLIAVGEPSAISTTLDLLDNSQTQEEQVHYFYVLSVVQAGWSQPTLERYFQWYLDAANLYGGRSFAGFLKNIRERSLNSIPANLRAGIQPLLDQKPEVTDPYAELKAREFVRKWTVADLEQAMETELQGRDFENGRKMFGLAQCYKCHRFADQGGIAGPDLTAVGRRFNKRDLLETVIDPNKAISDQYQATEFELTDGQIITGRVVNLNGQNYMVQPDMMTPNKLVNVKIDQIEFQRPSPVSTMPSGLLDNLTKDDILDLMAYLRSGGKKDHAEFQQSPK